MQSWQPSLIQSNFISVLGTSRVWLNHLHCVRGRQWTSCRNACTFVHSSRQERVWCSSSWKSISYQRMVTNNKETVFSFLIYHMPCTYLKILPIVSLSFIYLVILLLFTSHRLASRYPWVSSESQRGVGNQLPLHLKEYLDCDNLLNKSNRHHFFTNRQSNQANYFLQRTECYDYNQIRANNGQSNQANYFLQRTEWCDHNRPNKCEQRTEKPS